MRKLSGLGVTILVLVATRAAAQTSVTSAAPSSLRINAGGPAVALTVDGQLLAAVTGVRFLQNNQQAGGLTGVLSGPPLMLAGGSGRLTVSLSAALTVPVGTYQLELVAGTQRVATGVSITVLRPLPQRIDQPPAGVPMKPPQSVGTITITPSVGSASPATVTLRSGGAAQTVALQGALLNQVVAAYAQRNGNRVLNGVYAEVLPSSDASRREVRLSARGASGPWGQPLDLVLEYTIGSSPVRTTLVTPVKITAAAPPNVDLTVVSCSLEPAGNRINMRATIRNNGSEAAAFQTNQEVARMKYRPSFHKAFYAPGGGQLIAAGGSEVFTTFIDFPTYAPTLIETTWTTDPNDVVAESNADNNQRMCSLMVTPPDTSGQISDLAISALTAQPVSGPSQTAFVFVVTVENTGTALASAPGGRATVQCLIDEARFVDNTFDVLELSPREKFTREIRTAGGFVPGSHVFKCTLTPAPNRTDSNQNNNTRTVVVTVTR